VPSRSGEGAAKVAGGTCNVVRQPTVHGALEGVEALAEFGQQVRVGTLGGLARPVSGPSAVVAPPAEESGVACKPRWALVPASMSRATIQWREDE